MDQHHNSSDRRLHREVLRSLVYISCRSDGCPRGGRSGRQPARDGWGVSSGRCRDRPQLPDVRSKTANAHRKAMDVRPKP